MTTNDIVTIWVTKRDSFDISCNGITRNAVQLWFQKPNKKEVPAHGYGWEAANYKFISADFFGTTLDFPLTNVLWQNICDSEIGDDRGMWGDDEEHKHLLSSPDHFSNWIVELQIKCMIQSQPSLSTVPIWFTKGKDVDSAIKVRSMAETSVWFLKEPYIVPQMVNYTYPIFPTAYNVSFEEAYKASKKYNASRWDADQRGFYMKTDDFFRYLPNCYEFLKASTYNDFIKKEPFNHWMSWRKKYYLDVQPLEL